MLYDVFKLITLRFLNSEARVMSVDLKGRLISSDWNGLVLTECRWQYQREHHDLFFGVFVLTPPLNQWQVAGSIPLRAVMSENGEMKCETSV